MQENLRMPILLNFIHELNQPLTVTKAYLGGCSLLVKKNELNSEQMIDILQKITEQSELLEQKISLMQQVIIHEEYRDVPSIIKEILSLFALEVKQLEIQLTLSIPDILADFSIDKFLLQQILFRILKQCMTTVQVNKIQNAELTVQAQCVKENVLDLLIKSNFPITAIDLEHELAYCRSLLMDELGGLSVDLLSEGMCIKITLFKNLSAF